MGLFTKECAVCGRTSASINCAPLGDGMFLCATCDKAVRQYVKENTGRTFAPPARMFDLATLEAIVAGERPLLELPGDDRVDDSFVATGAVGTFARYNDRTRELLICPIRDVTGMEVHEGGQVIAYDDIASVEVLDDDEPVCPGRTGHCANLVVRIDCKDGASRDVAFLTTAQNRKGFAYVHTLEQARFLAAHLDEMRS